MNEKETIKQFPVFAGFTSEELDEILQLGRIEPYRNGAVIMEEASALGTYELFIILDGMVKVELEATRSHAETRIAKRLAVLKDGDVFGEIGLLRGGKTSGATVIAYSDLEVMKMSHDSLIGLFERNSHLGYKMMRNLAVILSERLVDLNFMWRDDI